MRKHIIENAAYEVATQVRAVEDSIDGVLSELAELQGRMIRARSAIGVGPAVGQTALEQLTVTMHSLVAARGTMAQCHGELAAAKQLVPGLRTIAFGDVDDCPDPKKAANPLRFVA